MSKGITYFCNDSEGNLYSRYSIRHNAQVFYSCTISRDPGRAASKSGTSYTAKKLPASSVDVAQSYKNAHWTTRIETVPVRCYLGRHAVEPKL